MAIDLVLSDDWELRGDGSGDLRVLQFGTARRLMDLYEQYGLRGTFNVEVMQQLGHRAWAGRHRQLAALADEWDECVREMHQRGHDVQLHVHPQWREAVFDGSEWRLQDCWSIIEYPEEDIRQMLSASRDYLQALLRPLDLNYRCRSFRSGSWSLAPSRYMLPILAELGIGFDMSMGQGLHYELPMVRLDYRNLDEPFLPYYPQMDDARRVSLQPEPIICVPTHSRRTHIPPHARRLAERAVRLVLARVSRHAANAYLLPPCAVPVEGDATARHYGRRWSKPESKRQIMKRLWNEARRGKDIVSDLSLIGYHDYRAAIADARQRSRAVGGATTPVIFENHTKNLGNMAPLEQFCRLVSEAEDIRVITAAELADGLAGGAYPIRCGAGLVSPGDRAFRAKAA